MAKVAKVAKLSEGAVGALEALKVAGVATASELKAKGLEGLNSAHLTALVARGLATAVEVEREVVAIVKRTVKEYTVTELGKEYKGE